jgi:RNA polymerase-binding transcription factor
VLALAKLQRAEVLDALRRIELGTYGTCVDCGGGVPEGRLEAKPAASRCVSCQAKWDRLRR